MKHKAKRVTERQVPSTVNGKVPPRRLSNAERRPREYLTPEEVELLITAAQKRIGARTPHRDATMILLAYRHGLGLAFGASLLLPQGIGPLAHPTLPRLVHGGTS